MLRVQKEKEREGVRDLWGAVRVRGSERGREKEITSTSVDL